MIRQVIFNLLRRRISDRRPPDKIVDVDYMDRWFVIPRNRWFNVYLHHFIGSDGPTLHDHPWWSVSWILEGAYIEQTPTLRLSGFDVTFRHTRRAGDVTFRRATDSHRIELHRGPVWTLFITGRNRRKWGFYCAEGWVPFDEYIEQRGPERGASGCGEL